jgi:hypothetical protein
MLPMTLFTSPSLPQLRRLSRPGYLFIPLSSFLLIACILSCPQDAAVNNPNAVTFPQLFESSISATYQEHRLAGSAQSFNKQYLKTKQSETDSDLEAFKSSVANGESAVIRGVYFRDNFAFPIIQQPDDKPGYVSNRYGLVTQFRSAAKYGVTGLLAHNYLAGKEFYKLDIGQEIDIIYGNQVLRRYQITEIEKLQKLSPDRQFSDYIELSTGQKLSTSEVFKRYYRGEHHVIFQTCLKKDGIYNWGLLFVRAIPIED